MAFAGFRIHIYVPDGVMIIDRGLHQARQPVPEGAVAAHPHASAV